MAKKNTIKLLVPLATAAVAAAVAVGSGASWTSQSVSTTEVTGGALTTANDSDAKVLTVSNMKPGDVLTGDLTISNTGSVPAKLAMKQDGAGTNTFFMNDMGTSTVTSDDVSDLQLKIVRDGTTIYDGNFGGFSTALVDITNSTPLAADDPATTAVDESGSTTITFMVRLIATANTLSQNQSASAAFVFEATPTDGDTGRTGDFATPPTP